MSPERQRDVIIALLGYKPMRSFWVLKIDGEVYFDSFPDQDAAIKAGNATRRQGVREIERRDVWDDFLNDLNAYHKAVMAQTASVRDLINSVLRDITAGCFDHSEVADDDAAINATAPQRWEAFLKAKDKWEESK